jgi:uncharacterized protein (TIGR04255 family)
MTEYPHLTNAPITEAVIDLRVKLPNSFHPEQIKSLAGDFQDCLPKREDLNNFEFKAALYEEKPADSSIRSAIFGIRFRSEDGLNVAACRINGFSFSRLKPYENWRQLLDHTRKYWELYRKALLPESVTRIGVRFINRIELPLPIDQLSEYFNFPLPLPEPVVQGVEIHGFLNRMSVEFHDLRVQANVIQALERGIESRSIVVILDNDVFKKQDYNVDDDDVWSSLDAMRDIKNQLFFESIKSALKRRFA